ncbi:ABC transporter [Pontixanthobacter aestiaquae]|uniref:ABC transporter n=1 Tax=Pontixanthobacter aestiaquae TaxID=1509367 RepID=A0A844Z826_9SPHN|nr:ABC transporter [Pontixanthobacter aestiaquae]MDN3646028.1 ABC transporter [Pontixanthobacter aestiaquae]MXO82980.1 ABC transporter [Pontixanthobacter aestiaquae]
MTARKLASLAIAVAFLIGMAVWNFARVPAPIEDGQPKQRLGLMTSLPIYWGEGEGFGDMLADDQHQHWVKEQLERRFELIPLDILSASGSLEPNSDLAGLEFLMLAQPSALAPADFVALDNWVKGGGMLLLFADPMLTEHSEFGLGDRRRPQDIALLGPILTRWGLRQFYDQDQPDALRFISYDSIAIPVHKTGQIEIVPTDAVTCELVSESVIASCVIGQGTALIVSDAAVLEHEADPAISSEALDKLLRSAFKPAR